MSAPRPVRVLPAELIHRIAAGEVVDHPASVLKELVENSIDAGAASIKATLVEGGVRMLEVEDTGNGMSRADLEACIQRHATSKVSTMEELEAIVSLGFRGEALAAISSVSRLSIETFREGDGAWRLEVTGGSKAPIAPCARKRGTRVRVEDLFFNTPARRKFLKRPGSEAQLCVDQLRALAAAHPEVAFEWHVVDDKGEVREQQQLPSASLSERFLALSPVAGVGPEHLVEVRVQDPQEGVYELEILALRPPACLKTQKGIRLSVNGRAVFDKQLPFALREAYSGLIEIGAFPVVQAKLRVDPTQIDVNIHPQKKEIRWPAGFSLAGLCYRQLRPHFELKAPAPAPFVSQPLLELGGVAPVPEAPPPQPLSTFFAKALHRAALPPPEAPLSLEVSTQNFAPVPAAPRAVRTAGPVFSRAPFRFSELRVIGEAGGAWILCEAPQGLILIDQHAAHERVNFEKCLRDAKLLRARPLLMPLRLELPHSLEGAHAELRSALEGVGFELADLEATAPVKSGATVLEIVAVPEADRSLNWAEVIEEIMEALARDERVADLGTMLRARVAASLACHGSIRRGQRLANEQIRALLEQLDGVDWGAFCPHGRPVWLLFTHNEIAERFHR